MQKRGTLPQTAGDVPIHYKGSRRTKPYLKERSIVLPQRFSRADELHELQGGRQLLFLQRVPGQRGPSLWFLGLDERHPFVTNLRFRNGGSTHWYDFKWGGGEAVFYRGLKPREIRDIERWSKQRAKRQGEWWFIKLPFSWAEIQNAHVIAHGLSLPICRINKKPVRYRSNHVLTGRYASPSGSIAGSDTGLVVEGVLEAPHHATRVLKGPHLLVRRGADD